jgi:hypothetical protein
VFKTGNSYYLEGLTTLSAMKAFATELANGRTPARVSLAKRKNLSVNQTEKPHSGKV